MTVSDTGARLAAATEASRATHGGLRDLLSAIAPGFVDGTPEGYAMLQKVYPDHVYDRLRRQIGLELAGKELAKILEAEDDAQLASMHRAVASLYEGREGVYAPVHDFWSLVEMILHVKKKELPELITAENVVWTLEDMAVSDLHLTWMPYLEQHPEYFGDKPWSISHLQEVFAKRPAILEQAIGYQEKAAPTAEHNFDQSDEPITLVHRDGRLELIDGNGRLYRALLAGRDIVPCQIGRMTGKMPRNYWVSAGALKQFCLEIRGYAETDLEGFASGLSYLRTKLRLNSLALINYELFLRSDFPEFEDSLTGILSS